VIVWWFDLQLSV